MRIDVGRGAFRSTAILLVLARRPGGSPRRVRRGRRQRRSLGPERGADRHQAPRRVQGRRRQGASARAGRGRRAAREPRAAGAKPTDTTIVSTKQDPTTALFTAFGKFRSCLDDTGVKFIGAPDASNPELARPTTRPTSRASTTCAAQSNIQQALAASQSRQRQPHARADQAAQQGLPRVALLHDRPGLEDRRARARRAGSPVQLRRRRRGLAERDRRRRRGRTCSRARTCEQCAAKSQKKVGQRLIQPSMGSGRA